MNLQQTIQQLRTSQQQRIARNTANGGSSASTMVHVVIAANATGDNVLVPPPGQGIDIYEVFFWNGTGAQTLLLKNGQIPLVQLSNFAAGAGLTLGFAGNNEPHFKVAAGNALMLNLSVGALVDGFVKYKIVGI
jgi:hypothetical protein